MEQKKRLHRNAINGKYQYANTFYLFTSNGILMEDDRTIIKQLISHQFSNTTFFQGTCYAFHLSSI